MDETGVDALPRESVAREAAKAQFLSLFEDCYFPEDRLTVNGELGFGTYASVYDCTLTNGEGNDIRVAVKKMDPVLLQNEQNVLDFFRETEFLSVAQTQHHPNILTFIGVSFAALDENTEPSLCIIEEYMNHGTLKAMIENMLKRKSDTTQKEVLELIIDVAKGLAFLHDSSVSVIHRDIKPANVLINKDEETGKLTAKLADFGLSVLVYGKRPHETRLQATAMDEHIQQRPTPTVVHKLVQTISEMMEFGKLFTLSRQSSRLNGRSFGNRAVTQFFSLTGQTGSLAYMAPEVFSEKQYNHTADVFSFAILAYEALGLVHPYFIRLLKTPGYPHTGSTDKETMEKYARSVSEGYRATFEKKWPDDLSRLLQQCWAQNPEERPAMKVVANRLEEIHKDCTTNRVFHSRNRMYWCPCFSCRG